jgi:Domain of unknown function (DUF4783)
MTYRMRENVSVLALVSWVFLAITPCFGQEGVVNQVKETIKAGSSRELSKFIAETVDVSINSKVETYSKAQAEFVLRDFFKQHPPKDFKIIHQGSSKGGLPYAIGQYISGTESFRVFIKIKNINGEFLVNEIRFDKE